MKTRVTVLAVEKREGKSDSGKPYTTYIGQCFCHLAEQGRGKNDGVGVLKFNASILPEGWGEFTPGEYIAEYAMDIDYKTRDLVGKLVILHRLPAAPAGKSVMDAGKESAKA